MIRGSPKISKKNESTTSTYFFRYTSLKHYGMKAVRNGQETNNAIRPELEKHAKKCYETWKHIDMNDGKLPDDFKTFDDWKKFRLHFNICRKLPKDDIPKSDIPYDCICTE